MHSILIKIFSTSLSVWMLLFCLLLPVPFILNAKNVKTAFKTSNTYPYITDYLEEYLLKTSDDANENVISFFRNNYHEIVTVDWVSYTGDLTIDTIYASYNSGLPIENKDVDLTPLKQNIVRLSQTQNDTLIMQSVNAIPDSIQLGTLFGIGEQELGVLSEYIQRSKYLFTSMIFMLFLGVIAHITIISMNTSSGTLYRIAGYVLLTSGVLLILFPITYHSVMLFPAVLHTLVLTGGISLLKPVVLLLLVTLLKYAAFIWMCIALVFFAIGFSLTINKQDKENIL